MDRPRKFIRFLLLVGTALLILSACSGNGNNNAVQQAMETTANVGTTNLIDANPAENTVIESAAVGTGTGVTALLDGVEAGTTVSYSLSDDANGAFSIDETTGVVTVSGSLDFETASNLVLTILATPSVGESASESFTIEVGDNLGPTITIDFPTDNSLIIGDSVVVRGTAIDPEGDAIDSIIVSVDGSDFIATVDADGNWSTPAIPLNLGDNDITVTITDANGEVSTQTISVNSQATVISAPGSALADNARNRILVVDAGTGGINIVDNSTGEVSPFPATFAGGTLPGSAGGPSDFQALSGSGEIDPDNDRLFVVEDTPAGDNLLLIDLTDDSITRLPVRVEPGIDQFVVDAANNRVLAIDPVAPAIIAIDLDDFSTSVISNNTGVGTGPDFITPTRIALDETGNQAIVYDEGIPGFITVDLDNGDRAFLAGLPAGITDPTLIRSIDVDDTNSRLLVVTPTSIFTVNLSNGDLDALSGDDIVTPSTNIIGNGPALIDASAISIDGTRALVSDNNGSIFAIDLITGDRSIIGSNPPALLDAERYTNVIVDPATGNVFLFAFSIDDSTLIINDKANGITLPPITIDQSTIEIDPFQFVVDFANNTAYFFTLNGDGIAALDLASGLLTIVSDNDTIGSGPLFQIPTALALDAERNRILYTDAYADNPSVRAVDLDTGDRSVFFNDNIPWPTAIIVDAAQNRALVADDGNQTVVVIDLDTADGIEIPALANPYLVLDFVSITIDSNSDIVYLISPTTRALTSVNITTRETRVVSTIDDNTAEQDGGNQVGNGLGFILPIAIAWDETTQNLFIADLGIKGIVVVEPNSGNRIIGTN